MCCNWSACKNVSAMSKVIADTIAIIALEELWCSEAMAAEFLFCFDCWPFCLFIRSTFKSPRLLISGRVAATIGVRPSPGFDCGYSRSRYSFTQESLTCSVIQPWIRLSLYLDWECISMERNSSDTLRKVFYGESPPLHVTFDCRTYRYASSSRKEAEKPPMRPQRRLPSSLRCWKYWKQVPIILSYFGYHDSSVCSDACKGNGGILEHLGN